MSIVKRTITVSFFETLMNYTVLIGKCACTYSIDDDWPDTIVLKYVISAGVTVKTYLLLQISGIQTEFLGGRVGIWHHHDLYR